ncbi:hypothetical protein NXY01_11715 [Bacteroides fragilis]|nr:hypothetical protein NXY01_11715 [Bacteroides fragilis]
MESIITIPTNYNSPQPRHRGLPYSRKTVSGLHAQPKALPLCPFSNKHRPRFTVHLDTIQLCPIARHISCIKAVFIDFLRNRQIYRISNCITRHNERKRIYNAFINWNGHCIPNRINMIRNDRISDHFTRTHSTLAGRNTINRIRTAITI